MSREGGSREPATRGGAHGPVCRQLLQDGPVLSGIDDHRDVSAVLRRGPDHRRAPDVDHLDRRLCLERVQVASDDVDRCDVLGRQVLEVGRDGPIGQDARVDCRMQGLHAPPQHLGHASELGDFAMLDPGRFQDLRGAAARHELDAEAGQAGELVQAGLVVNREKRTHSRRPYQEGACSLSCTFSQHKARFQVSGPRVLPEFRQVRVAGRVSFSRAIPSLRCFTRYARSSCSGQMRSALSDDLQGIGRWLASDGKRYPSDLHSYAPDEQARIAALFDAAIGVAQVRDKVYVQVHGEARNGPALPDGRNGSYPGAEPQWR